MRIAQVAPLWELVPPKAYGGTELVVHLLSEEMARRGHEVTLFAVAGSQTAARLEAYAPVALRELENQIQQDKTHCTVMAYELKMLQDVFQRAGEFDIIHNHLGFQALPFANFTDTPVVTTLHNALNPEPVRELFLKNAHLPYISISDYQQKLWPELNYAATIYHGINLDRFAPCYAHDGKDYLVFLGRLSPEKGPHHAIRIARELGMKLVMAGKIDRVDRQFYDSELAHLVDGEQIVYVGEVGHEQKVELLRNAAATLCPIEWPEPFGLVMIESMACGTPVFALRDGSVPEVIDQGVSGAIAGSVEELREAVRRYRDFDRRLVRRVAEKRFSARRMVDDHLRLYETLVARNGVPQTRWDLGSRASRAREGAGEPALAPLTASQVAERKHSALSRKPSPGVEHPIQSSVVLELGELDELGVKPDYRFPASPLGPELSEYSPGYFTGS